MNKKEQWKEDLETKIDELIDIIKDVNLFELLLSINQCLLHTEDEDFRDRVPVDFMPKYSYLIGLATRHCDTTVTDDFVPSFDLNTVHDHLDQIFQMYIDLWSDRPSLSGSTAEEDMDEYQIGMTSFLLFLLQAELGHTDQFVERLKAFSAGLDKDLTDITGLSADIISKSSVEIMKLTEDRYNVFAEDFRRILKPAMDLREKWLNGDITDQELLNSRGKYSVTQEELDENTSLFLNTFKIKSKDITERVGPDIGVFLEIFSCSKEINKEYRYPTDTNYLLRYPLLKVLSGDSEIFIPILMHNFIQAVEYRIEDMFIEAGKDKKYYRNRDSLTELHALKYFEKVFGADVFKENYYYVNDQFTENDIICKLNETYLIVETKAKNIRIQKPHMEM